MDNTTTQDTVPQLSQEKILQIMNMVKNKELSIEGALDLAQKETRAEKEAMSLAFLVDSQDLLTGSQFNFSVYKYKRYRWQKRILQIDFNTEAIFNIEKGIIKKQFPFSQIKSCEDSEERRFSITFHGRPDYELEAISLEDKRKVHLTLGLGSTEMGHKAVNKAALSGVWNETPNQSNVTCSLIECWEISHLVNKVIQSNSYRKPAESSSGRPAKCDVIHEGLLDFQQNSFASIKWVKCLVQLREGELSLYCIGQCGENKNADPVAKIVNLSDGNVSVIKENGCETFSVQTKEHNYLFRIPFTVQTNRAEDVSKLRNEWVSLIDRYCRLWKNRSAPQEGFGESISGSEYETFHISQNKQTEGAHCLAVCSEAAVLSLSLAPCSTPATGQAAPASSSLQPRRVQAVVPPPPFFPPPFRLSPALKRTKAFHWDVVPQEKIQKSIWASCSLRVKKIDESRIYAQFHIQDMAVFSGNETSVNQHIMLNQKVAHNFNIFLKSFHIKPNQLKEKLYILHEDAGGFTDEQITSLRRYLPTPNDIEMYQSFKGLPSELHVVDQFMLEMCKIPHLGQRLDLLLAIRELPMCMGDLEPLINQKIRACKQLQASQKFVAVLEYILAIGNYLNEKAGREKAKGFRLSSLTKLSLLRGTEKKITLLHALLEQIFLHEPDLAKFSQELTEFEAIPGASIKGLRAEVDVLKKELENVIQYRRVIKSKTIKATTQESQFYKELKDVIQKYEGHLSQLSKRCDEMKKLYNDTLKTECLKMEIFGSKQEYLNLDVLLKCLMQDVLCLSRVPIFLYAPGSPMMNHVKQLLGCAAGGEKMVKFGEQPDQDSQELFGWISAFIREFRKVSADIKS